MTMVQHVLKEDLFAGIGLSVSNTLCTLEKLIIGEKLCDADRENVRSTLTFLESIKPSLVNSSLKNYNRSWLYLEKSPNGLQLSPLIRDLKILELGQKMELEKLGCMQEQVLDVLVVINRCRFS